MNMGLACVWIVSVVIGQAANPEPVPGTAAIAPHREVVPDDVSWLLGTTSQVNGHRELGARLKQRHEWGCDNLSIRDAYASLFRLTGIRNWSFDDEGLNNSGITASHLDQKVTIPMRNRTGFEHLRALRELRQWDMGLDWMFNGDEILVVSIEHASEIMESRVYPMDDLLSPDELKMTGNSRYENLKKVIQYNTDLKWRDVDGEGGNLWHLKSSEGVIIMQTFRGHQQVTELLEQMRVMKGLPSASFLIARQRKKAAEANAALLKAQPELLRLQNPVRGTSVAQSKSNGDQPGNKGGKAKKKKKNKKKRTDPQPKKPMTVAIQ